MRKIYGQVQEVKMWRIRTNQEVGRSKDAELDKMLNVWMTESVPMG